MLPTLHVQEVPGEAQTSHLIQSLFEPSIRKFRAYHLAMGSPLVDLDNIRNNGRHWWSLMNKSLCCNMFYRLDLNKPQKLEHSKEHSVKNILWFVIENHRKPRSKMIQYDPSIRVPHRDINLVPWHVISCPDLIVWSPEGHLYEISSSQCRRLLSWGGSQKTIDRISGDLMGFIVN